MRSRVVALHCKTCALSNSFQIYSLLVVWLKVEEGTICLKRTISWFGKSTIVFPTRSALVAVILSHTVGRFLFEIQVCPARQFRCKAGCHATAADSSRHLFRFSLSKGEPNSRPFDIGQRHSWFAFLSRFSAHAVRFRPRFKLKVAGARSYFRLRQNPT